MKNELPATEKDLLAARVAARAKLEDPARPPRFLFSVAQKGTDGKWLHPEPKVAVCGDQRIVRQPDESAEEFEHRATAEFFSVNGAWPFVVVS